ncbi:hypothetical protein [Sinorhizobium psoraleae]|uniref:hypothetical protein n=1 Tax=Sinorhizobium psoraleae TaxID=520838 RepID=UPI0022AF5F31|nr:hypothetical protein [Sinorhizobium psoraleae]
MTNIIDLIPDDAITVADTPEYTAWKSQDGSEVFIDMKEPNTFVTDRILTAVVFSIVEDSDNQFQRRFTFRIVGHLVRQRRLKSKSVLTLIFPT